MNVRAHDPYAQSHCLECGESGTLHHGWRCACLRRAAVASRTRRIGPALKLIGLAVLVRFAPISRSSWLSMCDRRAVSRMYLQAARAALRGQSS